MTDGQQPQMTGDGRQELVVRISRILGNRYPPLNARGIGLALTAAARSIGSIPVRSPYAESRGHPVKTTFITDLLGVRVENPQPPQKSIAVGGMRIPVPAALVRSTGFTRSAQITLFSGHKAPL